MGHAVNDNVYCDSKSVYSILSSGFRFSKDKKNSLKEQVSSSIDHSREYHGATSADIASRSHLHSNTLNPLGKCIGEPISQLILITIEMRYSRSNTCRYSRTSIPTDCMG